VRCQICSLYFVYRTVFFHYFEPASKSKCCCTSCHKPPGCNRKTKDTADDSGIYRYADDYLIALLYLNPVNIAVFNGFLNLVCELFDILFKLINLRLEILNGFFLLSNLGSVL
jgi:hypothetical protein